MSQFSPDRPEMPRRPGHAGASANHRPRELPRCNVVLLQDPRHELMFIVRCVMELTRFCRAEATHKMWLAHHTGRAVLLTTYRERAELYAEQFAGKGLTVLIEPA
jgi:ATP-dependent Clp protease adapter protein ClpS